MALFGVPPPFSLPRRKLVNTPGTLPGHPIPHFCSRRVRRYVRKVHFLHSLHWTTSPQVSQTHAMATHLKPASEEVEVEVRWEDQQKINRFGVLTDAKNELDDDIKAAKVSRAVPGVGQ